VRRSSRVRRAPVRDDDARYFVTAYDKSTIPHQTSTVEEVLKDAEEVDKKRHSRGSI
jgi:hypothetical protein